MTAALLRLGRQRALDSEMVLMADELLLVTDVSVLPEAEAEVTDARAGDGGFGCPGLLN